MSKHTKEQKRKVLDSLTREELIGIIETIDEEIPDFLKKKSKDIIKKAHENKCISLRKLFMVFGMNSSTYFQWLKTSHSINGDRK
jgi:hypothetical protein